MAALLPHGLTTVAFSIFLCLLAHTILATGDDTRQHCIYLAPFPLSHQLL